MTFPEYFVNNFAEEKAHPKLSDHESQIFCMLFSKSKTRVQIQKEMSISDSALGTSLSSIYRKFGIEGSGPVKEGRLKDRLAKEFQKSRSQAPAGAESNDSNEFLEKRLKELFLEKNTIESRLRKVDEEISETEEKLTLPMSSDFALLLSQYSGHFVRRGN
jgi:ubiquitin C-terminal hydrolase